MSADGLSFVLFVVISRHFGPAGTGQYALGFASAGLIYMCCYLGLADYGIRESAQALAQGRQPTLSGLLAAQLTVIAVVVLGLVIFVLAAHLSAATTVVIVLLSSYQVGLALARTLFVSAFAREAMAAPALAELACRGAAILAALAMIVRHHASLATALLAYPAAGIVLVLVASVSAVRHGDFRRWCGCLREVWPTIQAAWPFGVSEIIFQLYTRVDLVMLSILVGATATGLYASVMKFVEVGVTPLVFVGMAAFPGLSSHYGSSDGDFRSAAHELFRVTLMLGGLLAWALYYVVPGLFVPLLGHRFASVGPLVQVTALLALLYAVEIAAVRVLLAARRQLGRLKLQIIGTAFKLAANLALIPLFGLMGALAASIASLALIGVLYGVALWTDVRSTPLRHSVRAFLAALAALIVVGAAARLLAISDWGGGAAALGAYLLVAGAGGLMSLPPRRGTVRP
ncbi:MAG: hypothetical protein B7Z66_08085 [Chromatiales bacterium 21-64-14]|nr:MAG: hypothetical protein B7Z66_08085 [Chromatiales bacterium 21-64-14]